MKPHFFSRIFAFSLCLFLLLGLCGCEEVHIRPGIETASGDLPVGGNTEETTGEESRRPRVALTFDDGPNHYADRTKNYVDALERYGFHATFFVVGNRISGGDALAYAVEHGNEIGIHGYSHDVYYDNCTEESYLREINATAEAIRESLRSVAPDYQINLMRPIGGRITDERIAGSPYAVVLWNLDSDDWNNKYYAGISDEDAEARVNTIVENVMSSVAEGDIILLHDIYESTYDATLIILERLYEEGFEVVTVSELLGDDLESGRVYRSAYN